MAGGEALTGADAVVVLCKLLGKIGVTTFVVPDPDVFKASKGESCALSLQQSRRPLCAASHGARLWVGREDAHRTLVDLV